MTPEEQKSLTNAKQNVVTLRNKLLQHQLTRIEPPASLLVELKMAELLLKLQSTDTMSVKYKVMYKV
jgi:hypothetical protein